MSLFGDSSEFVLEPGPEDCLVKCTVTRSSKGIDKGRFDDQSDNVLVVVHENYVDKLAPVLIV